MTKTVRNSAAAAEASFHKHYAAIWGAERWHNSLYPALAERTRQAALVNQYAPRAAFEASIEEACGLQQLEQISFPSSSSPTADSQPSDRIVCFARTRSTDDGSGTPAAATQHAAIPQPQYSGSSGTSQRLMTHWNLDAASALVAHLLDVKPGDNVLDLCAAPGGKSVALLQSMWPQLHADKPLTTTTAKAGHLRSNEFDKARFRRLADNLRAYLPGELLALKHVASLNVDSTGPFAPQQLSVGSAGYDKVLVDAPCSSERHIIHAHLAAKAGGRVAPEMTSWRPGSSKQLAKTQHDLLMTGLRCVRLGGSVLYATCSIEPTENDGVIGKVLASLEKEVKKGGKWAVKVGFNEGAGDVGLEESLERIWAERTKYGWIVLPDHPDGGKWGPLFFAMLTKVEVAR
ncbi:uncharacterized protein LTR77_003092 [Saxophila tyrrhenica]|uniref:NOL1/NOP2/Sun domain family member 4 n=1 Tax=Saxophila tyrrhenica TaxID=1690608 RepID=A0AAV9PK11_9PEZI|nr:hypothetical protein LTR77_003092 [Saxophila tyrrhenica]